jgi:hypothetical protein
MNKTFTIISLALLLCTSTAFAEPGKKVDVVVLGMINHGPMQPTVNAIKEVTSKYGEQVNVQWLDLESSEGQQYAEKHDLSAHLNIVINGKYQYNVNRKTITFQWFEGQQWTKEDLNAVIFDLINNKEEAVPVNSPKENTGLDIYLIIAGILAAIGVSAWFLTRKQKKR